jgi:hypothetical protein
MRTPTVQIEQRAHESRREAISAELRRRLRPACSNVPEDVFFEMIERMAEIQLKYELIEQRPRE